MKAALISGGRKGCVAGTGNQSRSAGTIDEVLHRTGDHLEPPRGARAQPFKLGRDFAQRQIPVRRMDADDKRHQAILRQAERGFAKEYRGRPYAPRPSTSRRGEAVPRSSEPRCLSTRRWRVPNPDRSDCIGPIDRPLREIVSAVDDPGFHQCALPRLAFV